MRSRDAITSLLADSVGGDWAVEPLSASSFTGTWRAVASDRSLFVKSVPDEYVDVLESEADGLAALSAIGAVRVPEVLACARDDAVAILALEWLDFGGAGGGFGERLGHALGRLHAAPPPDGKGRFGWRRDNRIGATPQTNGWSDSGGLDGWVEFLGRERLGAMRDRLVAGGAPTALPSAVEDVIEALPGLFADGHVPRPSLIHGDLWSGNWGRLADGTPVVFDPAVSCSDAEAEVAMMELFGQPPAGFREAYAELVPPRAGYRRRRDVYQLYHLLNHALLFGGGYGRQSLDLARAIVRT